MHWTVSKDNGYKTWRLDTPIDTIGVKIVQKGGWYMVHFRGLPLEYSTAYTYWHQHSYRTIQEAKYLGIVEFTKALEFERARLDGLVHTLQHEVISNKEI